VHENQGGADGAGGCGKPETLHAAREDRDQLVGFVEQWRNVVEGRQPFLAENSEPRVRSLGLLIIRGDPRISFSSGFQNCQRCR
jgi:hypothetical protein